MRANCRSTSPIAIYPIPVAIVATHPCTITVVFTNSFNLFAIVVVVHFGDVTEVIFVKIHIRLINGLTFIVIIVLFFTKIFDFIIQIFFLVFRVIKVITICRCIYLKIIIFSSYILRLICMTCKCMTLIFIYKVSIISFISIKLSFYSWN